MNKNQNLIDKALEQIREDVKNEDFTAIEELLTKLRAEDLKGFLSENKPQTQGV